MYLVTQLPQCQQAAKGSAECGLPLLEFMKNLGVRRKSVLRA